MGELRRASIVVVALAAGFVLSSALTASAATNVTVSPRDNCGGFNGHVVWQSGSSPYIQLYGEVWDDNCPGSTSVWLAWDSPSYHNVQADSANEPDTEGVNYETSTSTTPTDVKVTVCSTGGGWHCGTPVSVPAVSTPPPTSPPPTTSPTPTSPAPVVTTPTSTSIPEPTTPHELAVRLQMSWTWNAAITRLHGTRLGSVPGRAEIFVQCRGKGCPGRRNLSADGARKVRRLLRRLHGRRYRAGDRVLIILKAPGYLPERAMVRIRNGKLPRVTLLANYFLGLSRSTARTAPPASARSASRTRFSFWGRSSRPKRSNIARRWLLIAATLSTSSRAISSLVAGVERSPPASGRHSAISTFRCASETSGEGAVGAATVATTCSGSGSRKPSSVSPIWMTSPSRSVRCPCSRSPATKVPLRDSPSSSITHPPPRRSR